MSKDQLIPGDAPKSLLQELQEANPDRNVAFTAIDRLKEPAEIVQFFQQYVDMLKQSTQDEPEALAQENLGYIVGYYDKETADRWMNAIKGLSHPVFGRDIPFTDAQSAYEKGRQLAE